MLRAGITDGHQADVAVAAIGAAIPLRVPSHVGSDGQRMGA